MVGLIALESMACGTAVITSNTSFFPEIAGDSGLLFSPLDRLDLLEAMHSPIDKPEMLRLISLKTEHRAAPLTWYKKGLEMLSAVRYVAGN